jgi:signal transduction histidine kinase
VGDRLLALVAVCGCVVERLVTVPASGAGALDDADVLLPAVLLAVVVGGALLWRRRAPLAAYLVGTAGLAAESLLVQPSGVSPYVNLVGLVSVGWWGTPRRALWGPPVALAGIAAWFARDPAPSAVPVTVGAVWLLCWAFAYQQARARDGDLREREHREREAVREEREQVARELHDVVGHALSLMLVQIGAARTVLHQQPDTTRDLLHTAEKVGAEAMVELDRVLGLLRTDTDAARATGISTDRTSTARGRGSPTSTGSSTVSARRVCRSGSNGTRAWSTCVPARASPSTASPRSR